MRRFWQRIDPRIQDGMDHLTGNGSTDFDQARRDMVQYQLRGKGITCPRVLAAMARVPREEFVLPEDKPAAYEDRALAIAEQQTISQPFMVALMSQVLDVHDDHLVLEIGTGSGYQAAVLSLLGMHVYTVERLAELSRKAKDRLQRVGFGNVTCLVADGSQGYRDFAPFDRILVTAASPTVPAGLLEQLVDGGKLVIPVGDRNEQTLTLVEKQAGRYLESAGVACRFVPLIGEQGWPESAPGTTSR